MKALTYVSMILAAICALMPIVVTLVAPHLFVEKMVYGMMYSIFWLIIMGVMLYLEKRLNW